MSGQKKSFPLRLFEKAAYWFRRARYGCEETAWRVEWLETDGASEWQYLHTWYDDFIHETIRYESKRGLTLYRAVYVLNLQLKRFDSDIFEWRVRNAVTQEIIPAEIL